MGIMTKMSVLDDVVDVDPLGVGLQPGGGVMVTGSKTHSEMVMGGRVMVERQVPLVTVMRGYYNSG
jgi:hypothetical protein